MQDQIETIGMLLVKGVLLPVIGLAITAASLWLPLWIKSKVKNETVDGVLSRLTTLVFTVVTEVQQTVVSGLGDKANADALRGARDRAIETIKTHLGSKGIKELMTVFGIKTSDALDKLIISFIESAVHTLKASKKPMVEATAIAAPVTNIEEPKS